ncbi:MAG: RNA 3'-terminal phosphate cyclase [Hyphomicrobiaceae bacterium]
MLTIDGSQGEGGGQVLRTSLTLSMLSGMPVRIENIRAGRAKPGLLRQHLACVQAAARISNAAVEGAALGARTLAFAPQEIQGGTYDFKVASAGSSTLVFQTVVLPLLAAERSSRVTFSGGTHNPFAPTFDYLARVFVPLLKRMGARLDLAFERYGFYPAGGGRWVAAIEPSGRLRQITLESAGVLRRRRILALVANIPFDVARREVETARALLNWTSDTTDPRTVQADGPGNVLAVEIERDGVTEQFTGFGARGLSAEALAQGVVGEVRDHAVAGVPVGPHLADQLLLPMALAGAGAFVTVTPQLHTRTNIAVIEKFLPLKFGIDELENARWRISVEA